MFVTRPHPPFTPRPVQGTSAKSARSKAVAEKTAPKQALSIKPMRQTMRGPARRPTAELKILRHGE